MTGTERQITIDMGEGSAGAFFYTDGAPRPAVLFLTDIGGVRRSRELAARLSARGYSVLLPNVFHRVGEPPFFTPPLDMKDPRGAREVRQAVRQPAA